MAGKWGSKTLVDDGWALVLAEVLGFEHDEALTLGRAVAGLNTHLKGSFPVALPATPTEIKEKRRKMHKKETMAIDLLNYAAPPKTTAEGLRALSGDSPTSPEREQKYLAGKLGDALKDVSMAMLELAKFLPPAQLAEKAYSLYEKFTHEIPSGKKGGVLCFL